MTTFLEQIDHIKKAKTDKIPSLLSNFAESIHEKELSNDELHSLSSLCQDLFHSPLPACQRSILSFCISIINNSSITTEFIEELIPHLKLPLSSGQSQTREMALDLALTIQMIIDPNIFWKKFTFAFSEGTPLLKTAALDILLATITSYPDFKTKSFIKPVFSLLDNSNPDVRNGAYAVVSILHERKPETVEKLIESSFSLKSRSIFQKLGIEKGSTRKETHQNQEKGEEKAKEERAEEENDEIKSQPEEDNASKNPSKVKKGTKKSLIPTKEKIVAGSYAAAISQQSESLEEIAQRLEEEFNNPLPDVSPINGECNFSQLNQSLGRKVDWEKRAETLKKIVGYARKSNNHDSFIKGLQLVRDGIELCITDKRSALSKVACLSVTSLAMVLRAKLDQCSEWLLYALYSLSSNGTETVALPGEYASIMYVQHVWGKKTRKVIEEGMKHNNIKIVFTATKCALTAINNWNDSLCRGLDDIIITLKTFKSEKVRSLVCDFTKPQIIPISKPDENKDADIEESEAQNNNNEAGSALLEEAQLHEESLTGLIESGNVEVIAQYIEQTNCDILGFSKQIVSVILNSFDNNDNIEASSKLLSILCRNYSSCLYPFLQHIAIHLPNNNAYSKIIISSIETAYGENATARLLGASHTLSACEYLSKYAEKMKSNIGFTVKAVYQTISCGHFNELHDLIILLLKRIYLANPTKCTALISSLPFEAKELVMESLKTHIPSLYTLCGKSEDDILSDCIFDSIQQSQQDKIEQSLIERTEKSQSQDCILLVLAKIRESKEQLSNKEINFILSNANNQNNKIISTAASQTLIRHAEQGTLLVENLMNNFVVCDGAYQALFTLLQKQKSEDLINSAKDMITQGINSNATKYSALMVLGYICSTFGNRYISLCGELSAVNSKLLEYMMAST